MKVYNLKREQSVKRPLDEVFAFFEKAENLSRITPSSLGFEILTPTPIHMKDGTVIDYTIRLAGMPIHWRSLITSYEPPYCFVDVQLKGPYAFWHHTHSFKETQGGTLITDEVHYALPFGFLGRLAHALFVKRQLKKIFDYRAQVIARVFS